MREGSHRIVALAVAALLGLHFLLAVTSKRNESTTSDEIAHLSAGFTYWTLNDYRFQPENGNLPQRWAAIPAVVMGTKLPDLKGNIYWNTSDVWAFGHQFFYETGDDHFPRLMAGRAMIALFSVGLGLLIFCWSKSLFGTRGGLISLAFYTFFPSFLAHGALVTSDVCMAFFMLASVGLWWKHLHSAKISLMAVSAACFGLACVAKFSAVLLLPMMALLALVRFTHKEPLSLAGRTAATLAGKVSLVALSLLAHGAAAVTAIWASFGFRYSGFNPALPPASRYILRFEDVIQWTGLQGKVVHVLASLHALPEAFLYGYAYVIEMAQQRAAFLNGEYSIYGWRSYFVWAFFLKATLPLIVGLALTALVTLKRWRTQSARIRSDLYATAPLLVLFVTYWAASIASHMNIGERHILPTYPVMFIGLGLLGAARAGRSAALGTAACLLCLWNAGEALAAYPHYLSYFNELGGGPSNGFKHLSDSSVDWGQDLPGLKQWLDENKKPGEQAYLAYFGTGEPNYYNIRAERLPFSNGFHFDNPYQELGPGIYCIGATVLNQVYGEVRGPWTVALEADYERLLAVAPSLAAEERTAEPRTAHSTRVTPTQRSRGLQRFLALRLARLCYFLQVRRPDANIGSSIFIYRLTEAEVKAATQGSLKEWSTLITNTAVGH